jgi:hypothetical protein
MEVQDSYIIIVQPVIEHHLLSISPKSCDANMLSGTIPAYSRTHLPISISYPQSTLILEPGSSRSIMSALTQLFKDPPRNLPLIIGTSVASTLAVITLAKLALQSPPKPKLIPSPRETLLPTLTKAEQDLLSYPPDIFPGARDVTSPVSRITCSAHLLF